MKLWMREIELTAGDKQFNNKDFDIEFKVPFGDSKDPKISEVTIYNLTQQTIADIESKAYLILNAGYRGDIGNILTGKVEKVETDWRGVDKATVLTVSDGGFEWRNTKINKTYTKGSKAKYIMTDLAGLLGYEIGEIEPKKDLTYQLGKTISGYVEVALKQLVKDTESKMYINKNKIYIRDEKKGTETGFLLNKGTGLIDSPEKTEEEDPSGNKVIKYDVKCLLNSRITTDSIIQIESRTVNGNFRVIKGSHDGKDFITECTVVPL